MVFLWFSHWFRSAEAALPYGPAASAPQGRATASCVPSSAPAAAAGRRPPPAAFGSPGPRGGRGPPAPAIWGCGCHELLESDQLFHGFSRDFPWIFHELLVYWRPIGRAIFKIDFISVFVLWKPWPPWPRLSLMHLPIVSIEKFLSYLEFKEA